MNTKQLIIAAAILFAASCALMVAFASGVAALYAVAFGATAIICELELLRRMPG